MEAFQTSFFHDVTNDFLLPNCKEGPYASSSSLCESYHLKYKVALCQSSERTNEWGGDKRGEMMHQWQINLVKFCHLDELDEKTFNGLFFLLVPLSLLEDRNPATLTKAKITREKEMQEGGSLTFSILNLSSTFISWQDEKVALGFEGHCSSISVIKKKLEGLLSAAFFLISLLSSAFSSVFRLCFALIIHLIHLMADSRMGPKEDK